MTDSAFDSSTMLYPQERVDIIKAMHELQTKYMGRTNDLKNMFDFRKEATDRFRTIGFEVHVDFVKEPDYTNGTMVDVPEIEVVGRTVAVDGVDHERMIHEVQGGLLDGVEGSMKMDGTISEPSKKIL